MKKWFAVACAATVLSLGSGVAEAAEEDENWISGAVWIDVNGNGLREGEDWPRTQEIRLWEYDQVDSAWVLVGSTLSHSGGYGFSAGAGAYQVQVIPEQGERVTAYNASAGGSAVFGPDGKSFPVTFADNSGTGVRLEIGVAEGVHPGNELRGSASGWCLDQEAPRGTPTNGVGAYGCNGGGNQHWTLKWITAGSAEVRNKATGQCLDQEFPGGAPSNGVGAYDCNGGANQRWLVRATDVPGSVRLVNAATSDCLDQESPLGPPTTGVGAHRCNGAPNQVWTLAG
ncbi:MULTISPECIES: RICIN domain-containing protein [Actinosynnema]|uniref:RICIN domain-containing protein n=1 Tax=Actinosynnema TaxID=40566 RepID=UPI0020A33655|nr:RICIN domain-containing protein [Actinosynnema pretiosum]MCP2095019.1 Ricin-type beta-trefoil lectin domain-containing protein [Actinosynnema pretiosum]